MIILDANMYRLSKKAVIDLMVDKNQEERLFQIGVAAIATGVPIIITAVYVGENFGFTSDLQAFIERLKKFYLVETVINIQEQPHETEKKENL